MFSENIFLVKFSSIIIIFSLHFKKNLVIIPIKGDVFFF